MAARVVSFISEKGGTGKTTACYHIAIALVRYHGKRLLVVDTDYQRGGITGRFMPKLLEDFNKGAVQGTTLYHVFRSLYSGQPVLPKVDVLSTLFGVDLISSDPRLKEVSVDKLPGSNNIRENNLMLFRHLSAIRDALSPMQQDYDYILVDTHPETSELLRSVICASHYCVSPVKLDEQSSVGVPSAIEAVNGVNADVQTVGTALGIADQYQPAIYVGAIGMMAREYGGKVRFSESVQYRRLQAAGGVFDTYVTEGDGLRQAAQYRQPVYDVDGQNAAKQSKQLLKVTKEFLAKCP